MLRAMWAATFGKSAALTEKEFTVFATVVERGVFIEQRRVIAVGSVRARSIEEAREEVAFRFADMSGAYPAPRYDSE